MGDRRAQGAALAQTFLSAPLTPGGWDIALKALARDTGAARGQLLAIGGPYSIPFNHVTDAAPGIVDACAAIGGGGPDVSWRVAAAGRILEIVGETQYCQAAKDLKTDIYDDYADWADCRFGCQTTLHQDSSMLLGLAVLRTRDDGPTTQEDRATFAAAAPHALTAVRMQQAIEHQGALLAVGAFEAMGAAVYICDRRGRVMAMSRPAEESLRTRPGLRLRQGWLSTHRSAENRAFQRALGAILHPAGPVPAPPARLWLDGGDGALSGRICEIFPLPHRKWGLGFEARAMIVLRTPGNMDAVRSGFLTEIFPLTPAEAEVAAMAAEGLSREEIAARRNTTPHTVNSQFKSIFGKTDVKREAELVALFNRLLR